MKLTTGAFVLGLTTLGSTAFAAGDFAVNTDSWNYNGSVTRFATLADAQNNVNSTGSGTLQNRDGALFQGKNAPTSYMGAGFENTNVLLTAWYYTIDTNNGAYSGWGNPNNTNDSFVQLYDDNASTVTSSSAFWSGGFTTLNVSVAGGNTDANDFGRVWPTNNSNGQGGSFLSYNINYAVSGLNASFDPSTGWMLDNTHRGNVSGTFDGIFQNNSVSNPANNGFYRFNVNMFNGGSTYGEDNLANLNGAFNSPFFAAPVPEPASFAVLGLGALALIRRRRSIKSS